MGNIESSFSFENNAEVHPEKKERMIGIKVCSLNVETSISPF